MFPQLDPTDATYLAGLILNILGVLLFFVLAVWMIQRKKNRQPSETPVLPVEPISKQEPRLVPYEILNPLSPEELSERSSALQQAYRQWKAERLLPTEEGRRLFLRTGVEKSGLRYQLVASTQTQALAILISTLMAEADPQASVQAEALFASLLAHPAFDPPELSSWKFMPDLPRSPKLDPDAHAELWAIYSMLAATKRWPGLNRFHYPELMLGRLQALNKYAETLPAESLERLPFSGYLLKSLKPLDPVLNWSALDRHRGFPNPNEWDDFTSSPDTSRLGLSLLQSGMLALLDRDPESEEALRSLHVNLIKLVDEYLKQGLSDLTFSTIAMLSCTAPALITLQERELTDLLWANLSCAQPDKNDSLGATLRLLAMAFLANQV
ncbi:MAG: hypothetical protein WDA04_01935 [Anaerolineaceae bacterium]|nr:hypothetical protein [Anaerolineaceae bacterium]